MIQDIAPHHLFNQYRPEAQPDDHSFVIFLKGMEILACTQKGVSYPTVKELAELDRSRLFYLFHIDEEQFFLYDALFEEADAAEKLQAAAGASYTFVNLRTLREQGNTKKDRILAAYTAKHLADWYRDNRFCGRCGTVMVHSKTERAKTCPSCKYTAYPRIMPAVIVGVVNKDKLLITRYRNGYNHNALIAGFTEIGETLEETVSREVMEEAGIRVKNIRYYKSQPWGVANDILTGFFCDVDGDDAIRMDDQELKYAQWLKGEEIELQPDEFSLTNEMMKLFKSGARV